MGRISEPDDQAADDAHVIPSRWSLTIRGEVDGSQAPRAVDASHFTGTIR